MTTWTYQDILNQAEKNSPEQFAHAQRLTDMKIAYEERLNDPDTPPAELLIMSDYLKKSGVL
jgi:hypothetical protein